MTAILKEDIVNLIIYLVICTHYHKWNIKLWNRSIIL